jgi:hypothetical protein
LFNCVLVNGAEVLDQATEGCQLKDCTAKAATAFFVQLALVSCMPHLNHAGTV